MSDFYNQKEKEILSYLSKQDLSIKKVDSYSITKFINLQFSKIKIDDTWFEMNRAELIEFLKKRNNEDFSILDKELRNANIGFDEHFYVNFS